MSGYSLMKMKAELDPRKQLAAQLLVESEFRSKLEGGRRTLDDIGDEISVTRQTIAAWRKEPMFVSYMAHLSDQHLDSKRAYVDAKLFQLIEGGNNGIPAQRAVELYYKLTGRLVDRQIIETVDGGKPQLTEEEIDRGIEDLAAKLRE